MLPVESGPLIIYLNYIFTDVMQTLFNIISNNWLLSLVLTMHIIYLVIISAKLKRNTD